MKKIDRERERARESETDRPFLILANFQYLYHFLTVSISYSYSLLFKRNYFSLFAFSQYVMLLFSAIHIKFDWCVVLMMLIGNIWFGGNEYTTLLLLLKRWRWRRWWCLKILVLLMLFLLVTLRWSIVVFACRMTAIKNIQCRRS